MSKKAILVQILVLMFALQSVWGVAEASCLHEMTETFNTSHDDRLNKTAIDTSALDSIEAYCAKVCFQDKCGHFGHHISLENDVPKQQSIQSSWTEHKQSYHWQNSYQSLFLNLLNPPPQFPPL